MVVRHRRALVGVPKPDHFGDIDTSCNGLITLPAEERHGLLFVHPDPGGEIDLDGLLGEWFDDEFPTWNLDAMVPINHDAYDTACNWKLAMDTFGETYHFSSLHKETLFNSFHGNVQCSDEEGHLHRMVLCRRDIDQMRLLPEDQWDITVAGLPVYWIFPNVILMPFRVGAFLVRAYPHPSDPGRHVSKIDFHMKGELAHAAGEQAAEINDLIANIAQAFAEIIRDEDYVMGESQQVSANAGLLDHVVFGRNEPVLHHYHRTYAAMLGEDTERTLSDQPPVAQRSPTQRSPRIRARPTPPTDVLHTDRPVFRDPTRTDPAETLTPDGGETRRPRLLRLAAGAADLFDAPPVSRPRDAGIGDAVLVWWIFSYSIGVSIPSALWRRRERADLRRWCLQGDRVPERQYRLPANGTSVTLR